MNDNVRTKIAEIDAAITKELSDSTSPEVNIDPPFVLAVSDHVYQTRLLPGKQTPGALWQHILRIHRKLFVSIEEGTDWCVVGGWVEGAEHLMTFHVEGQGAGIAMRFCDNAREFTWDGEGAGQLPLDSFEDAQDPDARLVYVCVLQEWRDQHR